MNHLENTQTALRYWLTVPKGNVVKNLENYRESGTGVKHNHQTIACFGGWVPAMPEFASMGVKLNTVGGPIMGEEFGMGVARELFGKLTLFAMKDVDGDSRHRCDYDDTAKPGISDHGLVTHRLKEHIKHLEEVA